MEDRGILSGIHLCILSQSVVKNSSCLNRNSPPKVSGRSVEQGASKAGLERPRCPNPIEPGTVQRTTCVSKETFVRLAFLSSSITTT